MRVLMQRGLPVVGSAQALAHVAVKHRSKLVPDDLSATATAIAGDVQGHRQTTDAYLIRLAEKHGLTLSTFDQALAERHPRQCERVG